MVQEYDDVESWELVRRVNALNYKFLESNNDIIMSVFSPLRSKINQWFKNSVTLL